VEEGRFVEVVPGLGKGEVVDAVHVRGSSGVLVVLEVGEPVGKFGPVRGAEEQLRAVGGGDRVEGDVLWCTAARQYRCQQGLGAPGGARRVG
jgi:hypothetical protein